MNLRFSQTAILFVFFILMVGCQSGAETIAPDTATPRPPQHTSVPASPTAMNRTEEATATLTNTPTPTPTATETTVPTPTFIIPDVPPETQLSFQCLAIKPGELSDFGVEGTLVFRKHAPIGDDRVDKSVVFLDLSTGQQNIHPPTGTLHLSPNRRFLAFGDFILDEQGTILEETLIISDAKGDHIFEVPWPEDWIVVDRWASDDRLVIYGPRPAPGEGSLGPLTRLIYNPFTGETQLLEPELRGAIPKETVWSRVSFNPQLTQVVYNHYVGDDTEFFTIGLWDLASGQLVVSLQDVFSAFTTYGDFYLNAFWAPDGSKFAFVNKMYAEDDAELYVVRSDGAIERVTNLMEYMFIRGNSMSWSPDGRYIATYLSPLVAQYSEDRRGQLAVIDTLTGEVTDYCLTTPPRTEDYLPPPIWSPDGTQLVVGFETYEPDPELPIIQRLKSVQVILVDLEKGTAVQIAEDMLPVGWMLSP